MNRSGDQNGDDARRRCDAISLACALLGAGLFAVLSFPGALPWSETRALVRVAAVGLGVWEGRFAGELGKPSETGQRLELRRNGVTVLVGSVPKETVLAGAAPAMHVSKSRVLFRDDSAAGDKLHDGRWELAITGTAPWWVSFLSGIAAIASFGAALFFAGRLGWRAASAPAVVGGGAFLVVACVGLIAPFELPQRHVEVPATSIWMSENGGLRAVLPLHPLLVPGKGINAGWNPARLFVGGELVACGSRTRPMASEAGGEWSFSLDGRLLRVQPPAGTVWKGSEPIRIAFPVTISFGLCGWVAAVGGLMLAGGRLLAGRVCDGIEARSRRWLALDARAGAVGGLLLGSAFWVLGFRGVIPHGLFAVAVVQGFGRRGWGWIAFGFAACAMPAFLAIFDAWRSQLTNEYLIAGLVPFSDAGGYFIAGWENHCGRFMNEWCGRRPLYPAFLAGLFGLCGGQLKLLLLAQASFVAACLAFAARSVITTLGPLPAWGMVWCASLFWQRFAPICMTENLGVACGLLAAGLLVRWAKTGARAEGWGEAWLFAGGITALALALLTRPGIMGILPLFALAGVRFDEVARPGRFVEQNWRLVLATAICTIALLAFETAARRLLVLPGDHGSLSNFAHTFYGLATGQTWMEASRLFGNDYVRVNAAAIEAVRANPWHLVFSVPRAWLAGFGPGGLFAFAGAAPSQVAVSVLFLLGGVIGVQHARQCRFARLSIFSVVAVFCSIWLAPPWDAGHGRFYAATVPLFGGIVGRGLLYGRRAVANLSSVGGAGNLNLARAGFGWVGFPSVLALTLVALIVSCFVRVGLSGGREAAAEIARAEPQPVAGAAVIVGGSSWRSAIASLPGYPELRKVLSGLPDGTRVGQMEWSSGREISVQLTADLPPPAGREFEAGKIDGVRFLRNR